MNANYLNSSHKQIHFILTQKFFAHDYLEPSQLSYYKCLNWSAEYLKSQLAANNGTIHRDSLTFLPIYQECTPASLPEQLLLSFRMPADRTFASGNGYVIIRPKNK